ncbi:hypothetical protein ACRAWD_09895 [Caulobacter segnis]
MYDYAVAMLDFDYNPFRSHKEVCRSRCPEPEETREFSPEEITKIFNTPLFQGFEGDGKHGYRKVAGTTLIRDAKYWLPDPRPFPWWASDRVRRHAPMPT